MPRARAVNGHRAGRPGGLLIEQYLIKCLAGKKLLPIAQETRVPYAVLWRVANGQNPNVSLRHVQVLLDHFDER